MSNKTYQQKLDDFTNKVQTLWKRGYAPITEYTPYDSHTIKANRRIDDCEAKYEKSPEIGRKLSFERFRTAKVEYGEDGKPLGSGRGYILYGDNNLLPVELEKLVGGLPFTAQGIEYITNTLAGNGLGFCYEYVKVNGENVSVTKIPYECAGTLLVQRIKSLRDKIASNRQLPGDDVNAPTAQVSTSGESVIQYRRKVETPSPRARYKEESFDNVGTDEQLLQDAIEDYRKWKETMDWILEFTRNSGSLNEITLQWASDTALYNMSYMRLMLEQGKVGSWGQTEERPVRKLTGDRPRIVGMAYMPAQCSRLEAMDDNLHINYVYYSERWRFDNTRSDSARPIVTYPCIEPSSRWQDLENIILDNQKTAPADRPNVCAPLYIKGTNSPYYSTCPWWSILPSMIYMLTYTLMRDMATAKRNSTMWSKLIFIDVEWFERYATQKGAETDEDRQQLRDEFVGKIKEFISHRGNQGGVMTGEKITTPDGKTSFNIEIVDVPQPTSKASLEDLEKLTSCIFFALGLHPALVGAVPGANKSSSGTQQRELALLKALQLIPTQKRLISLIDFIRDWDDLDPHLKTVIKRYDLSTLDRSDTGLVENTDND